MALQNTRALLFRGEDTSYGGASAKEVVWANTAIAAARPIIVSLGFLGSTTLLNNLLGAGPNVTAAMGGLNRLVVNRSPRFWMTLTCQLAQSNLAGATVTVAIPIAPRQSMFLPHNVFAIGASSLTADSSWPLTLPGSVSPGYAPPTAGTTAAINFDFVAEQ